MTKDRYRYILWEGEKLKQAERFYYLGLYNGRAVDKRARCCLKNAKFGIQQVRSVWK